ncbi:putative murein peptide carboxypeptidase [Clostridium saccharobutylicum]|uniref:Putative murein peptide carboxypeptidase n=1 Tax=Clostridium saccharobutylicum TaxID=169679 RepID=A0A1S8NJX5_CLOSA|nr:putative murein peptide carboxypeptidase [Clostridium saccharobutylicum]
MATKPQILHPGDTVGIVTLGSPLYENVINARIQTLQNFGLKVVLEKYVYSYNGYLGATEQQRASDLMDMFKNPDVKAIIP